MNVLREFNTANFRVVLSWEYEKYPDISWDETGEVAAKLQSGEWGVYQYGVTVYGPSGEELATDYLGNSIYADPAEFIDHRECGRANREYRAKGLPGRCGSYFADMVKRACTEARERLASLQSVRVRSAAPAGWAVAETFTPQ